MDMLTMERAAGMPLNAADEPPLTVSKEDEERLSSLAALAAPRSPEVARLLLEELDRARLVPADEMPADVVTMHAHVE